MNDAAMIIDNIACFDEKPNVHIGQLGQFNNLDNIQNIAGQFENGKPERTYEQGLKDGRARAEDQAHDYAELSKTLEQNLSRIKCEIEASHRHVVTAILQAALPALAKKNMVREIADFIMSLSSYTMNGQVKLSVHPDFKSTLELITENIANTANDLPTFTIKTDENLLGNAVCATWRGGSGKIDIERTVQKLLSRIEQK